VTSVVHPPFQIPALYVVLDAEVCEQYGWSPIDLASACLAGGARLFQIRAKRLSSASFLEVARRIVDLVRRDGGIVIVNDRADIARLSGAAGVHVGQDDLSPSLVRPILRVNAIVGLSTHTVAQLEAAGREPVSYLAIGPVFQTATKDTGYEAVGLTMVRDAAAIARDRGVPLAAICGVTLETAADVIRAGASSVAVIRDLLSTGNPRARVAEYLERLTV